MRTNLVRGLIKIHAVFILFACLSLITACKRNTEKFISEGVIEYKAKVVDQNHPMAALAPGKMTVRFKKNKFAAEMSTMGVFTTTFIADVQKRTVTQMVKVFDVKNATIESEKEFEENKKKYNLVFEETGETKEIAGYRCKKLTAKKVDDPTTKFEVYYTDELDVENPNFANTYHSVPGILMEYRLMKFGLEMSFTAESIHKEEISDNTFELPGYYKIISQKEMDDFFKSIQ